MCLNMTPSLPKPQPLPVSPTAANPNALRMREDQARRLRERRGRASTQLTGTLGDTNYGMNIGRATVLGGGSV